jgi:hypothetical protein
MCTWESDVDHRFKKKFCLLWKSAEFLWEFFNFVTFVANIFAATFFSCLFPRIHRYEMSFIFWRFHFFFFFFLIISQHYTSLGIKVEPFSYFSKYRAKKKECNGLRFRFRFLFWVRQKEMMKDDKINYWILGASVLQFPIYLFVKLICFSVDSNNNCSNLNKYFDCSFCTQNKKSGYYGNYLR